MPVFDAAPTMIAVIAALAYLLGSVPFGLVVARAMGLGDVRQIGSGNIGATNVLRTGSKPAALATLVLDGGKGALAVVAAGLAIGGDAAQVAGLAAFIGHVYPIWLRLKGGKGVATFLGTLLALTPLVGAIALCVWILAALLTRISSLSALIAAATSPVVAWAVGRGDTVSLILSMTALIFLKHAPNIRRLMVGTEPRIGTKKEDRT